MNVYRLLAPLALTALLLVAGGCRTTHEATDSEMGSLNTISNSVAAGDSAAGDNGEAAIGTINMSYPAFLALAEKPRENNGGPPPPPGLGYSNDPGAENGWTLAEVQERFGFRPDLSRDAWPDCIDQQENRVEYDACEYGAAGGGGSVDFLLDGHFAWTDTTYDADLLFDLAVSGDGASADWVMDWDGEAAWSDMVYQGTLAFNYAFGVSLGDSPVSIGTVTMEVDANWDTLTFDEDCADGPVSGSIHWNSTYREGTSVETLNVDVLYLACGQAEITW